MSRQIPAFVTKHACLERMWNFGMFVMERIDKAFKTSRLLPDPDDPSFHCSGLSGHHGGFFRFPALCSLP